MSTAGQGYTARQLVQALLAERLTQAEIAKALDRSSRMVSKIARGETSGATYLPALQALLNTGQVPVPPPRRRAKDGSLVKVRGKAGTTVTPIDPAQARAAAKTKLAARLAPKTSKVRAAREARRAGKRVGPPYEHRPTIHLAQGGRLDEFHNIPKSGLGRERARADIMECFRSIARSQGPQRTHGEGTGRRRVSFVVTYERSDGSHLPVEIGRGGYLASDVLRRSRDEGNDPLAWLDSQRPTGQRGKSEDYPDLEANKIVGLVVRTSHYDVVPDKKKSIL